MDVLSLTTLVAYVDGELADEDVREVEEHLRHDPDARDTVRRLRESVRLLRTSQNGVLDEKIPARLIETVLNHETNEGNGPAPFRETPVRQGIDRPFWRIAAAIVILVAGAGGGYLTSAHQQRQGDEAARIALEDARTSVQAALFDALENVRSGEAVHWKSRGGQSSGRIIPVRTYRKEDAGYCREYQRASEGSGGSVIVHGVACRGNDGRWFPRFELVQDAHIDEATTW